jgi:hypothetical protein
MATTTSAGGGGGYSGGGGGYSVSGDAVGGGGGGSFDASTDPLVAKSGVHAGSGEVVLTFESVCFAQGTRIRTPNGEVAVENLAVGGLVVTASGETRPIVWLGHRAVNCRRHAPSKDVLPVRVAAHAFGDSRPARDLLLSPAHAVCLDIGSQALVPISALVNGATIAQIEIDAVTYWHVELDRHDILIAEGLATESYLDVGNRGFFLEAGLTSLDRRPDAALDAEGRAKLPFCRPFYESGALVEAARAALAARAEALGWRLEDRSFAGLHLLVDGVRVEPVTRGLNARFAAPAGAKNVWLVCETSRPCDVGHGADLRDLGLPLRRLSLDDGFGSAREIALDDPGLGEGFYAPEGLDQRWTQGRAKLSADLFADLHDGGFLRIELCAPALPRWAAPPTRAKLAARAG